MRSLYSTLIAYWPLYEASGTRVSHNQLNNLTDNNTVTQLPGIVLYAADFEVTNTEWLSLTSNSDVQMGDIDFTFSVWFNIESKGVDRVVIAKQTGLNGEYIFYYDNATDRMRLYLLNGSTGVRLNLAAGTLGSPSLATWYHAFFWHDSINNSGGIRINDSLEDTGVTSGALGTSAHTFGVGGDSSGAATFDGQICEIGMWKRLLTTQEKTWVYNSGFGRSYPFDGRPALHKLGRFIQHRRIREVGLIR